MNSAQTLPATPSEAAPPSGGPARCSTRSPRSPLYFWVIKVLCTTVGETFADNLNENLGLGLTDTSYLMAGAVDRRPRLPVQGPPVRARHLLAGGGVDQRRRHPGQRQPGRKPRGRPGNDDDRLRRGPDPGLRRLVRGRAHALGPHHLHDPARGLLLAGDPLHLRPRNLGRRLSLRAARTRLPGRARHLRRGDRPRRDRCTSACG